ncbi:MAG: ABC transporter permease, partial [Candidatus Omnitrophota bacterium]|nr:ABC transporter permease [Candidatus Omnitrophota bacterium]
MIRLRDIYLFLRKAWAFIRRDFLTQASYRMNFFTHWFGLLISIFTLYYISKLVDVRASSYLASYGVSYFPFVLVGIAATSYIGASMNSFSSNISNEIWSGTLELMLSTPTSLGTIMFSLSIYNFILATIKLFLFYLF